MKLKEIKIDIEFYPTHPDWTHELQDSLCKCIGEII